MKILWPGCHPLKHVVWWAQRWQTSRRWNDGCAEGKIPATAVQPLRFWDWLPGRGSWAESSSLQGREKVAPGWGVSSMTGKSRTRGILTSGHCTGGNPGKWLFLYFLSFGNSVPPWSHALFVKGWSWEQSWDTLPGLLGSESGSQDFHPCIRTTTCSPTTVTYWYLSRHQFPGPQIRGENW